MARRHKPGYDKVYYLKNRDRILTRARARFLEGKKQDPLYYRRWHIKRKYGLTPAQWNTMFEEQGKSCALCRTDTPSRRSDNYWWHTDHDHKTGKVRGILCSRCNTMLGYYERAREMADVLEAYLSGTLTMRKQVV